MAKEKVTCVTAEPACEHQRGIIQDNHLKALVTSPLFQARVEPSKKGKAAISARPSTASGGSPANSRWQASAAERVSAARHQLTQSGRQWRPDCFSIRWC